jgi:hypothetical protein
MIADKLALPIRSAGAAAAFGIDAIKVPFLNEHLASFCMLLLSLPLTAIVIHDIKETSGPSVELNEDVRVPCPKLRQTDPELRLCEHTGGGRDRRAGKGQSEERRWLGRSREWL